MDKILFQNEFLAIVERDGYFFLRETRCDGIIVALLPFKVEKNTDIAFLARLEICPAHGTDLELCSITGGHKKSRTIKETAQMELWEEAGYQVDVSEFIDLGYVRPSKAADTTAYLFAIDVSAKLQSKPVGDQSRFEANSSVEWVDYSRGVAIKDPLFVTALTRLSVLLHQKDH